MTHLIFFNASVFLSSSLCLVWLHGSLWPGCLMTCLSMTQSCLTLCNCMDCSPPDFSVHEILKARILEWVAIPFSRRSAQPRDQPGSPSLQTDSSPSEPPGKPVAWSLPTYLLGYYCYLIFNSLCLSITGFIQYIQCFFLASTFSI